MLLNINDIKLDFSDVLLVPKRSKLASRKDVNLTRTFHKNNRIDFFGTPIIASNMATGNFNMLEELKKDLCFTAIAKHHNKKWNDFIKNEEIDILNTALNFGWYTIGMCQEELDNLVKFKENLIDITSGGIKQIAGQENSVQRLKICVDIANGYSQKFASYVSQVRELFPENWIMAGNVCTPEMTQELILSGADIVKIGIGPGCFIAGTKVDNKNIEDIKIGDNVTTHTGEKKKVIKLFQRKTKKLISINGIKSTNNHEYYIIYKKDKEKITEQNLHDYAKWIAAKDLNKNEHLLIKVLLKIEFVEIIKKQEIELDKEITVYDLTVEDNHSYTVDNIIVHNSACTTRLKTGIGYPQVSACIENADVAHGLNAFICSDGGTTCPGDVAKAFAANADFVMIGGQFAGTNECDGEEITKYILTNMAERTSQGTYNPIYETKRYKIWYGMSSEYAQDKHFNGKKEYRTSEGRVEEVECKGPVRNVMHDILGGLRSACTYIGAHELRNMGKCSSFIRVSKQHNRF